MKRILVGLDELLDTRLGIVSLLKPEVSALWLDEDNLDYFTRNHDNLIYNALGWDKERWFHYWNKRETIILKNSVVTYIPDIINNLALEYQTSLEDALSDSDIHIDINLYPYVFTQEEQSALENMMADEIFPVANKLRLVRYRPLALTREFIKNNYDMVFMYYFNHWLELHEKNGTSLKNKTFGQVQFFIPRIYNVIPDINALPKEQREISKKMMEHDLFQMVEHALSVNIRVIHIPISDWCAAVKAPLSFERSTIVPPTHDQYEQKNHQSFQHDPLAQAVQESKSLEEVLAQPAFVVPSRK